MRKSFKHLLIFISLFLLCVSSITLCYAHPNAEEHDEELFSVLFEEGYSKYQSEEIKNNINAINYASNLCIDQYGGSGEARYKRLKQLGMGGLPWNFSTINYSVDFDSRNGTQISPNTHRKYTHQGWDIEYNNDSANKFWKKRRTVLLGTLNTIFGFTKFPFFGYGDKCNALAGIIYIVHILGDINEADDSSKIKYLMHLAGRKDTDQNDMISALRNYIEILFSDQEKTEEYKDLIKGFDEIEKRVEKIYKPDSYYTTDEFTEYHQCADDLFDLLKKNMPKLLKREEFFKKKFYPSS